jgi:3-phosphoshikimate 1-carboxyvinyltransferase
MSRVPVDVRVPGDKSITHRALILATLAEGESRLDGLLDAADTRSTRDALRALGARLPGGPLDSLTVPGLGTEGLLRPDSDLDCGNSGTTARLLLGLLAGCREMEAVVTGDASLRRRPMRRVTEPLTQAGARFEELGEADRLPVRVRGHRPLQPIRVVNRRASAQVKTAMLLAGLTGGTSVSIVEGGPSRDHTERMLQAMGADLGIEAAADRPVITLAPRSTLSPVRLRIPGDFSSAAFFLALAAVYGAVRARGVGLNPTRIGALRVLERMGAGVREDLVDEVAGEPVGAVTVRAAPLSGTTVTAGEVPTLLDEIPLLAAIAARAEGESRFEGVGELRVKESDRIRAMEVNLRALGVETRAGPDHLAVVGTRRPLRGRVEAFGDHRIAMAFGVLAALPDSEIQIAGSDVVAVSYPAFWDELERIRTELAEA